MANRYYVIIDFPDSSFVLGLEGFTFQGAMRAIRWQWHGGAYEPMFICTYDRQKRQFVSVKSQDKTFSQEAGRRFHPTQSIYTDSAWSAFLNRLEKGDV